MTTIPYELIVEKIISEKKLSKDQVEQKISEKLQSLGGLVSKDGAAHIVANDLGVDLSPKEGEKKKVKDLFAGIRNVEIALKVMAIYETREFNTGERKGKVASILAGDETGVLRVVFWNDQVDKLQGITENQVITVKNAYVKENQGRKELHLGDNATIVKASEDSVGEVKRQTRQRVRLSDLPMDETVEVVGNIVQVFDPTFYEICPQCNKRVKADPMGVFSCAQHGKVEPATGYVLNAFLDDGSENTRLVMFKNQAQNLFKVSDDEFISFKTDKDAYEQAKKKLLGSFVKVIGVARKNAMFDRVEFFVNMIFDADPQEEIKRLQGSSDAQTSTQKPAASAEPVETKSEATPVSEPVEEDSFDEEPVSVTPASISDEIEEELFFEEESIDGSDKKRDPDTISIDDL